MCRNDRVVMIARAARALIVVVYTAVHTFVQDVGAQNRPRGLLLRILRNAGRVARRLRVHVLRPAINV